MLSEWTGATRRACSPASPKANLPHNHSVYTPVVSAQALYSTLPHPHLSPIPPANAPVLSLLGSPPSSAAPSPVQNLRGVRQEVSPGRRAQLLPARQRRLRLPRLEREDHRPARVFRQA